MMSMLKKVVLFPISLFVAFFGSDGKVAAHVVQLCGRSADALHLRLRHLHRLPSNLGSVSYPASVRVHLLHPLFRCNCHHRGYRALVNGLQNCKK